jgi:dsDNA-binding SOS-regulon protein
MAVEVRYHVIRDGKEVAMYTTKKEADEHDKMLDIANQLSEFIESAEGIHLDENVLEELSVHLARNREDVIRILKGSTPRQAKKPESDKEKEKSREPIAKKTAKTKAK